MNLREQLTCKYCKEIFNEPISLNCCGENICKRHIDELFSIDGSNTFLCLFCDLENSHQNSSTNKLIQSLIEYQLHKLEIDSKYKLALNKFKAEILNLETLLNYPYYYIYEEVHELKRLVDLDREKFKSEVDKLADDFIKQLEECEEKFKSEYSTNVDLEHYTALVESSRKQLAEFEQFLGLFSVKREEKDEKINQNEKEINSLRYKIKEVKNKLFSGLAIKYIPMANNIQDLFGRLIIKVSFYTEFMYT